MPDQLVQTWVTRNMSLALLVTGAVAFLTVVIYYFFIRNFNYWKAQGVVGPKPVFPFGNIRNLVLKKKTIHEFYADFYNDYPNEKYVGLFRFQNPVLLLRDYDLVKQIMIKDFDKFTDRFKSAEKGLGLNLFATSGNNWKLLRNKFSPIFTSGKLKGMFHLLNERGDKFADYLSKYVKNLGDEELNIYSFLQKYTKSGIASCAFGIDIDVSGDKLLDSLEIIDKAIMRRRFTFEFSWMFPELIQMLNIDLFPSYIKDFFYNLVRNIFEQRKGKPSNRNDFMDLILEIKNNGGELSGAKRNDPSGKNVLQIDDNLIAAQAFVFYFAGFETSASTMSFLIHELAYNQDIQERLATEINEVIEKNGKLTYDALQEMTYLTQCIDETLRKYAIADPLERIAMEDYKIPGTNVTLEKNTAVLISVRGFQLDEEYYPDPLKFDPERFSPESDNKTKAPYLPFGIGPRNCIGMRFGQLSTRLCLAKLLPMFRILPANNSTYDIEFAPDIIVLTSKQGIRVKLIPRQK